jgi:hypothetical protein
MVDKMTERAKPFEREQEQAERISAYRRSFSRPMNEASVGGWIA